MEALGAISEGVWSSLGGMYVSDEADFMAQLLGRCTLPYELEGGLALGVQSNSWPNLGSSFYPSVTTESAMCSSGISGLSLSSYECGTSVLLSGSSDHESYYFDNSGPVLATDSSSVPMDYCLNHDPTERSMECGEIRKEITTFNESCSQLQVQLSQLHGTEFLPSGNEVLGPGSVRKRSRSPEDLHQNTRIGRSKVARKLDFCSNNEEEVANVARPNRSSSSPCNSEDDSIGGATCSSLSPRGSTINNNNNSLTPSPNSKTRASRGSATDPQSLYARKRREKINERLRILQTLVPNGTKVDISTMLDEAVHYVKFLQLQIKLLSSDEMWMYAPIAYKGMDSGLNKIAKGRQYVLNRT